MTRSQHSAADLVFLSNEELARRERLNRRNRSNPVTMGDERDHADLHEQLQAMRLQVEQLQAFHRQQPQPSLNGGDKPHTYYRNRSAIVPPPIARQDYDIKGQLIQLAEQKQFCGLPNENPMEHIERIEQISTLSKANGVSPEYLKCKLFEFSLAGKALSWLKALAPGSLVGWEAARNAFIDKYYTKAKTISLKAKISGYTQHSGESFSEAWERFCSYRRDCPHHGFTDTQLLTIFYDGLSWDFKGQLNAASNGNFMTRNIADALQLIENMAESSSEKCPEYDRGKRVASVEAQQIADLNAKLDMLLKANQRGVNSCDREGGPVPSQDNLAAGNDDEEECNYVTGHG